MVEYKINEDSVFEALCTAAKVEPEEHIDKLNGSARKLFKKITLKQF